MNVCVFCGFSFGVREAYADAAREFAVTAARAGHTLVYGGASVGLMGVIADAALAAGGEVVGVIPKLLVDKEIAHGGLTKLHVVQSMEARKTMMAALSDAFVALPGGLGTLDELFEMATWNVLSLHHKPCAFLDVGGYWRAMIDFLDHAAAEGFVRDRHRDALVVETDPARLLERLMPPGSMTVRSELHGR